MIKIIAAVGKNLELGKDNNLIWNLPGDLKFFKEQTMNKVVVMGRNTFNSLPKKLKDREHVVLTDNLDFNKDVSDVRVFQDYIQFMIHCLSTSANRDIFIIGGASIYKMFIDVADELYLTEIDAEAPADVYFPQFNPDDWSKEVLGEGEDEGIHYTHVRYFNKE